MALSLFSCSISVLISPAFFRVSSLRFGQSGCFLCPPSTASRCRLARSEILLLQGNLDDSDELGQLKATFGRLKVTLGRLQGVAG